MDLINDILRKMNIGGNNPKNRNQLANFLSIFMFIALCICFTLGSIFIKTNEYKSLGFCMRDSAIIVTMCQVILILNINFRFRHLKSIQKYYFISS